MNVFMTSQKLPFFGGTYFPPVHRYNMPSFRQILVSVAEAWRNKRDELLHSANDILGEMRRVGLSEFSPVGLTTEQLDNAFQSFARTFDATNGGFGGAPKFPPSMALEFLLRYYKRTGNENALEMVRKTCQKMAEGGIYDQLGGGFHRYAVDAIWLAPHFEKMLYDNAQLIRVYLHLFQVTKDGFFKRIAEETLAYITREMLDEGGAFYSTQDADSEGEEGKFFIWEPHEIEAILGEADARTFNFYYDVSEAGNFEEKNILNVNNSIADTARVLKISEDKLKEVLERGRKALFEEREKRIKPFRDEKVLTAWNGLMLAAFAEAAAILGRDDLLEIAKRNADFVIENMQADGRLLRTWKAGKAKLNGYLEDYANFTDGLVELYQASGELKYIKEAKRLADLMITEFWDEETGGFYFTSNDHEELIVRTKDFTDNASPSGNSAAADVFLKLAKLLGDERYERFAVTVLRLTAPQIRRYPNGFGKALSAMEFYLGKVKEIVVIGEKGNELEREIYADFLPNKVVVLSSELTKEADPIPLLAERGMIDEKPTAYVCEDFVCQRPVTTVAELWDQIN
jgi:uncharacterized protein YyaL (SSP411 family)